MNRQEKNGPEAHKCGDCGAVDLFHWTDFHRRGWGCRACGSRFLDKLSDEATAQLIKARRRARKEADQKRLERLQRLADGFSGMSA